MFFNKIWTLVFPDTNLSLSFFSQNDYAQPYQLGFQDSASPIMEGIVDLHHDIMFFMTVIMVFILYLLVRTVMLFNSNNKVLKVTHGKVIEIVWTIAPSFILAVIAIPSFALLYSMDEVINPAITIKAVGHQWYWSAPSN